MSCSAWKAGGWARAGARALIFCSLSSVPRPALGGSTNLSFAAGQIVCEIVAVRDTIPERVLSVLPLAMKTALEHVGAPTDPARLTIRLLETPPFYKRLTSWFRVEAFAIQQGDEIRLRPGDDPLKLAFRIGHELSHWLACTRLPSRPPLWLDEGLAQLVGAAAADACARTHKQSLERPRPSHLADNLFPLDELVTLQAYPKTEARSAAFYWQAEALVRAIQKRLGPAEFAVYLGLLSVPNPPNWQAPLRGRWYFSDWDFHWLAEQIRPKTESQ